MRTWPMVIIPNPVRTSSYFLETGSLKGMLEAWNWKLEGQLLVPSVRVCVCVASEVLAAGLGLYTHRLVAR